MASPSVVVTTSHASVEVYLNDRLHLRLPRSDLLGLQSWVDGERGSYFIEYMLGVRDVLTEYDKRDVWEAILLQIDDHLWRCGTTRPGIAMADSTGDRHD